MIQNKRHIFAGVIMTDGQSTNPYKLEDTIMKVKLKGIEIFSIGKYVGIAKRARKFVQVDIFLCVHCML